MDRQGKLKLKDEVAEVFGKSKAVIFAEYRGLTVEELTILRKELRKAKADFKVIKNRVAKKAIESDVKSMAVVADKFKGPVGVVCAYGDTAQATKAILNFEKDHPNLVVTAAYMEEASVTKSQLQTIADLPSREVLLGQIVGSMVAPHRGLLGVLTGVHRNLLNVLNAIKDKKTA